MNDLLAIDVGNTLVHLGVFRDGELTERAQCAADGLDDAVGAAAAQLLDVDGACAVLASVNDELAAQVVGRLELPVNRVEADLPVPIGRQLDPEAIVGVDRLLNAAAAYDLLKQSCVVVDAGTAVTVDFIDGAGTFHGGAIAPGAQLMLDALHEHTAQLPQVDFAAPGEPMGHNTVQAMCTAAFHGIRGLVRELVEMYAEQVGAYPAVIATGGDAQMLFDGYELIERIVPELTLMGLALALRTAMEQGE